MADHIPIGPRRRHGHTFVALLLATVVLSACGGGGDGSGDGTLEPNVSPTRTPERSVTASLPSPTRTAASRTLSPRPSEQPSDRPSEQPTATATVTESAAPRPTRTATETAIRTTTVTATPTAAPVETPSETLAAQPSATPSPAAGTPENSNGFPSWWWWLLAALLVAGAVVLPLVLRSRRRAAWHSDLVSAEDEVAWFARTLLPELRTVRTAEGIGGGWRVSEERVAGTEDRLTTLVASAPDPQSADRAMTLRDGVRAARNRIRELVGSRAPDATADVDAVIVDLEAVLAPPSTPPSTAPSTAPSTG